MITTTNYQTKEQQYSDQTISKLRKIARERAKRILENNPPPKMHLPMEATDLQFLAKFISETAFYVEELEHHLGEELTDFWEIREHALRILTGQMMERMQEEHSNTCE